MEKIKYFTVFCMCLGAFLTTYVIGSAQLSGKHTWAEGSFDAWSMVIAAIAMLISLVALFVSWDD